MLTQKRLKEVLSYDPKSGFFLTKKSYFQSRVGGSAGKYDKKGYCLIYVDGAPYLAHRLAFLYMKGSIPDIVDHIDRNPSNNAWDNLRPASKSLNRLNCNLSIANKSGCTGVHFHKASNKWRAGIVINGKKIYLGAFTEKDDAIRARQEFEEKYFKQTGAK
jgi:hypothetical protein